MSNTAFKGPITVFGSSTTSGRGVAADYNTSRSPSLFDMGLGIADPRLPFCYSPGNASFDGYGWMSGQEVVVIDQVPSTLAANNIAASQATTTAVALTLVASTAAGITISTSITSASTGRAVTGLLAIDTAMSYVQPGSAGGNRLWDPTKAIARNVRITSDGDDRSGTFLVSGYDVYGYPMSELITGSNASVASGVKAFKYISSILPGGTIASTNTSAGTGDVIGLPLRCDLFPYLKIFWPDATGITASTGFVAAVTTDPATTITGDVRGTWALQTSASNNSRRLIIFARVPLANMQSSTGLFGVTQV